MVDIHSFTKTYYKLIFDIVAFDLLPTSLINLRVYTAMYKWLISTRLPKPIINLFLI